MRFNKYLAVLPIALSLISMAHAKGDIFYTVPMNNVEVKPASKIYVNYTFAARHQRIVCTLNKGNDAITSVEWSYKGATRKIDLPVTLKDDELADGFYADPQGQMVITNEYGSSANNGNIYVTCGYSLNAK